MWLNCFSPSLPLSLSLSFYSVVLFIDDFNWVHFSSSSFTFIFLNWREAMLKKRNKHTKSVEKFSECNEKFDNSLDSSWATRKLKASMREGKKESQRKSERNALVNSILDDFLDFLFAKATVARCAMNFNFSFSYRYAISATHTHTHTETKWQIHKSEVNSFLALAEAARPPSRLARIIQFNCSRRRRCWCRQKVCCMW